jgi:hypothetical protein
MDNKRKYFGVNAVRKGRKKGSILRLGIHPRNVAVSCSVCGSPCKLGAAGQDGRLTRLGGINKCVGGGGPGYGSVAMNGQGTS